MKNSIDTAKHLAELNRIGSKISLVNIDVLTTPKSYDEVLADETFCTSNDNSPSHAEPPNSLLTSSRPISISIISSNPNLLVL